MQQYTYQFAACADGWRKAKPILIENISHETAVCLAYGYAILFGHEVRYAEVTGYDNLEQRNILGEHLGNGSYVWPDTAKQYISTL